MSEFEQMEAETGASAKYGSFRDFFQEQRPRVTLMVAMSGATMAEAEDAAQEAMREIALKWGQVEFPAAYARTIALRSFWRERNRLVQEGNRLSEAGARGGWPAPRSTRELDENSEYVLNLLNTLSREQRTVMALTVDGYDSAAIAEITGQPSATVRSNLRHARRNLARRLDPNELPEALREEVKRWTTKRSSR